VACKLAIVALARDVVDHLLANHEIYVDSSGDGEVREAACCQPDPGMDYGEMVQLLTLAGYIVRKPVSK